MRILSLFDGMACGMIAFKVAGIPIDSYDAYEIDKFAVQVATHNFPEIREHGDVFQADFKKYEGVDYVIGGSPCVWWSIAQSPNKRETTASGLGWDLFSQYVRAIKEAKPKYFIYENNKSMAKAIYDSISATFGFEPIMINSALVSAQNRERYYWVGKRNENGDYDKVDVQQPEDRGILLKDVLDNGIALKEHSPCIDANYFKGGNLSSPEKQSGQRSMVAEPVNITDCINSKDKNGKQPQQSKRIYNPNAKAVTVTSGWMPQTLIRVMDRELESVKNADSGIIAIVEGKEHEQIRRVRGQNGKCKTVSTCGGGNIEPKVFMQVKENTKQGYCEINPGECVDHEYENSKTRRGRKMQIKENALKTSNEFYQLMGNVKLHKVESGQIEIKGKKYPVKLKDGYYVIRKLTVRECARLQTIPEWYEFQWAEHYEQQFGKEVDICNYAKLKAAINLLQTEKLNSAININCDLFGMVQQNSQGQLLTIQKNAKQKDATGNSKQLSVTVYCTTKDGNENSQLTKQKCALYVENRWDTTDATKCAVSIINNGYSTETLYITKNENLSLMEILNVNTSKQMTEDGFIELLRRRYLEENSMQKKLYIISTLTNWIILRTIYMCATIKPTWLSIDSLNDWQHHSLTKDLLSLKMGTMSGLSNSSSYKCIGNGWTIEVIAHLIRATQEGKTEAKQLTFWEV